MLLFLADNLVTFPYLVFEEPLFVLHNIDLTLSVTGASILQAFREVGHFIHKYFIISINVVYWKDTFIC